MTSGLAPKWASAPGSTIKAIMAERHLDVEYLAAALQVPVTETEALLEGHAPITADRARRLSATLGASPRFWLTREAEFVEDRTRVMAAAWSTSLPVKQMRQFGWIHGASHWRDHIDQCLDFFGVADYEEWQEQYPSQVTDAHYRTSTTFDSDTNATLVWFRAGERQLNSLRLEPFDADALRARIPQLRALTRRADPAHFIPEVQRVCAEAGLAVVIVRAPDGCKASGATRWLNGRPVVQLSARYLSDDHFWFTLAHEIGHVLCHGDSAQPFIDFDLEAGSADALENDADRFAESLLVGDDSSLLYALRSPQYREVIRVAAKLGISPGVLVGQLQHRGLVPRDRLNGLKRRYRWDGTTLVAR